jgi:GNAT superfamily N-acetyltransferase
MSRTTVPLAPGHLDALVGVIPCSACAFWELDPVRRQWVGDPAAQKRAWVERVLVEWGSCGRVALVDDVPVGLLLAAPAAYVPGAAGFPTAPVSADAVLLTMVRVAQEHARGGLGKMLVQGLAHDLVERGDVGAVEAFGDTRGPGRCTVPADFLGAVGFTVQRAHPTTPRMRMELRSAISWREEVGAVLGRLRVARPPAPRASGASRQARQGPGLLTR